MNAKGLRLSSACLVALGILVCILQYYGYVVARAEQRIVDLEIGAIKRFLKAKIFLDNSVSLIQANWQDKKIQPWLSQTLSTQNLPLIHDLTQLNKGSWGIFSAKNQLVYRVQESQYFKSHSGEPFIFISLIRVHGKAEVKVSAFQWCKHRTLLGCKQW